MARRRHTPDQIIRKLVEGNRLLAGGAELGVAAACVAIAVHGLTDSFLSFTGTYIVMAVALGLASACPQGAERHAYRV